MLHGIHDESTSYPLLIVHKVSANKTLRATGFPLESHAQRSGIPHMIFAQTDREGIFAMYMAISWQNDVVLRNSIRTYARHVFIHRC
jgi:hypothetical protein